MTRDPRFAAITKPPTLEGAAKAVGLLVGTPADIIDPAEGGREALPQHRPCECTTPLGTPLDVQLEDWFAKEVIPAFRSTMVAEAAE